MRIMLTKILPVCLIFLYIYYQLINPDNVKAVVEPLQSPNNKFGIHIISATSDELKSAKELVNSSGGDWGYITVLIESKDRNVSKWQSFFDELRVNHLIPIVRLATQPEGVYWKRPYEGEEIAWADFLNNLNWPAKNRYVVIYNEPNQAQEWGNLVDAKSYARVLYKTITALKEKSDDFFVLNAGFDASAPEKRPSYQDEYTYLKEMESEVPGIFNRLDGWVSHSYPNPGFVGLPTSSGRGTVKTFEWELQVLSSLGVTKSLPVFITETGWKHAEGINFDKSLPLSEKVAQYYQYAFQSVWNNPRITAVTPFLLNYQEHPFDHFSLKKITGEKQDSKILGLQFPEYYPIYETIANLPKNSGKPVQSNKAKLVGGEVYPSIVAQEEYFIPLTFKNIGQSIWNESGQIKLVAEEGKEALGIQDIGLPTEKKVKPNEEYTFYIKLKSKSKQKLKLALNLYQDNQRFENDSFGFEIEVKSPVVLRVKSSLLWKKDFSGEYFLSLPTIIGENIQKIILNNSGESDKIQVHYLLPDYDFDFTLKKPFYKPKTLHKHLVSGENELDFGTLQPDLRSAILQPKELWRLLPFSK